jgi:inorganic pyrophosphatase
MLVPQQQCEVIGVLTEYLLKTVHVTVDRPLGSRHPEHPELVYPVNYGYLPGTVSGDGEEIDAYILGVSVPVREYDGVVIAVVNRKDDAEDKLVVADAAGRYGRDEIAKLLYFQERFYKSEILLPGDRRTS